MRPYAPNPFFVFSAHSNVHPAAPCRTKPNIGHRRAEPLQAKIDINGRPQNKGHRPKKSQNGQSVLDASSVFDCSLKQEANVCRNTSWAARPTRRNVKRCALCHGKLGLGARFRNIWNGTWWVHVRFCSARCEAIYQQKQNDATKDRWHVFHAGGVSRS